jgi:hypothetical protein
LKSLPSVTAEDRDLRLFLHKRFSFSVKFGATSEQAHTVGIALTEYEKAPFSVFEKQCFPFSFLP